MVAPHGDVTVLLKRWTEGDSAALSQLLPIVYGELQQLASHHLRGELNRHTMQTTALVHEAYLRMAGQQAKQWKNRGHFLAVCSQLLRQVLVDAARSRRAVKRNSGIAPLDLDAMLPAAAIQSDEGLIALNDALVELAKLDPLKAQVVDLKYFGGFSVEEIAEMLEMSPTSVKRYWSVARAFLYNELKSKGG